MKRQVTMELINAILAMDKSLSETDTELFLTVTVDPTWECGYTGEDRFFWQDRQADDREDEHEINGFYYYDDQTSDHFYGIPVRGKSATDLYYFVNSQLLPVYLTVGERIGTSFIFDPIYHEYKTARIMTLINSY